MYSRQAQYKAYNMASQTVSKTRQIVMLYDGAISFVRRARDAIEHNEIEERYKLIQRASDIIHGLQNSLDFENGGDVARILFDFYTTLDFRLIKINLTNDTQSCDRVIDDLKAMRDAWEDIDRNGGEGAGKPTPKPVELVSGPEEAPAASRQQAPKTPDADGEGLGISA